MSAGNKNSPSINAEDPLKPYLTIEPSSGFRSLRLRDIWEFRDLLWVLGIRDIKLVYKQTALGVLWVVLQPLIGAGIFTFVFGILAEMPSGELPYFVFSFAGMLGWTMFSSALNAASMVMISNQQLVSKIYFPRLILPLASGFQPLVNMIVGLFFMAILMLLYGVEFGQHLLLLPVASILLWMLSMGISFFCCSIMVFYRDLRFVIPVAIQFLLYASPVGYSLEALGEKVPQKYQTAYMLNPLSSLVELFRYSILGECTLSAVWLIYSTLLAMGVFVSGAYTFRRAERRFADVI